MRFLKSLFIRGLLLGVFVVSEVFAGPKASLSQKTEGLQKTEEIARLFKETTRLEESPEPLLKPLWEANEKRLVELRRDFRQSMAFIRGDIEDEKTLSRLLTLLQLSLLKARALSFEGNWSAVREAFADWFLFAADLPYEESSLVGLRTSGVIRSLLLDEFEGIQQKFGREMASDSQFRKWFLGIRAPWPVDRVMISEAKRLLKPPMMPVATAAAKAFQKNPYQTSRAALARVKGGQSQEAEFLKQIWREGDIDLMKTEINRIGKMQLRLAQAEFEKQNKKPAASAQDLLNAGLLERIPIDYFTGQPLRIESAAGQVERQKTIR